MRLAARIVLTAIASLLLALGTAYLAIEAYIYKYLQVLRLPSREALANDYGAAFDSLIIATVVFVVCLSVVAFLAWRLLGRVTALRNG